MDPQRLLEGLDPSQRRAVASPARPLAILAGAGSGKTRVLTRRIAYRCATGDADPRHVLAITFTRRAAGELDSRLRTFGLRDLPAAGTFHAVAYAQLRTRWAASGTAAPTLLDRKGRVLGRILGSTTRMDAADLAAEIEWARARLVEPDRYPLAAAQADRRTPVDPDRIAEWYRRYEQEKRRRGLVDFDDLLAGCAEALEQDPSFAAAQRWRFRHLFVDEYQDVNPLQERLLRAWLGDRTDLCVVGDPNQAIYGWNGADASLLVRFADHHPGAEVIRLERAYRSTPQILATAAAVLAGATGTAPVPEAARADGPIPRVSGYATDVDEANGIARAVHDHHGPGRPWSAQAVLVRTNAQAALLETAFRRAAIPYRLRGAQHVLDEPEVRDLLRRIDRLHEPLATTIADLESAISAQREALGAAEEQGEPSGGEAADHHALGRRLAAYELLARLGHDLLVVEPTARSDGFGEWLRATLGTEGPAHSDAVTIATFHAAKGLEWAVVHLAGLEAGYVPITHARTPEARAEERRLFYVAVTRAADLLCCTWAATRTFGAQAVDRKPSPYLTAVRVAGTDLALAEREPASPLEALARSRARLERSEAPADDRAASAAVRAGLRRWRDEQARRAGVSPTVVLGDRALEAVAVGRPTDEADLARIVELGPLTRDRHGASLLALVAEHDPTRSTADGART